MVTDEGRASIIGSDGVDKATQTVTSSCNCCASMQSDIEHLGEYKIDETLSALTPMVILPITTRASCLVAPFASPAKVFLRRNLLYGPCYDSYSCARKRTGSTDAGSGSTDDSSEVSTNPCEDFQCR